MTGGLFRAIGELSGLDKLVEEQLPEMVNLTEDDVLVPPEVQAANLSQIFAFLEQHSPASEGGVAAAGETAADADPEPPPAELPAAQAESETAQVDADPVPEPEGEPQAPVAEAPAESGG